MASALENSANRRLSDAEFAGLKAFAAKADANAGIRQLLQIAHRDLESILTDTRRGVLGLCRTEVTLDGVDHFRLNTSFEKGVVEPCRPLCVNEQRLLTSQSRDIDNIAILDLRD